MTLPRVPTPHGLAIRGVLLRSVLLLVLDGASPGARSVAQLSAAVHRHGFRIAGRPGKVVSDALRWEVARGRVRRIGHNRYAIGRLPGTTRWRCGRRLAAARAGAAPPWHLHGAPNVSTTTADGIDAAPSRSGSNGASSRDSADASPGGDSASSGGTAAFPGPTAASSGGTAASSGGAAAFTDGAAVAVARTGPHEQAPDRYRTTVTSQPTESVGTAPGGLRFRQDPTVIRFLARPP